MCVQSTAPTTRGKPAMPIMKLSHFISLSGSSLQCLQWKTFQLSLSRLLSNTWGQYFGDKNKKCLSSQGILSLGYWVKIINESLLFPVSHSYIIFLHCVGDHYIIHYFILFHHCIFIDVNFYQPLNSCDTAKKKKEKKKKIIFLKAAARIYFSVLVWFSKIEHFIYIFLVESFWGFFFSLFYEIFCQNIHEKIWKTQ